MIEIRPFEGSIDELQAFITSVWRSTYKGNFPLPLWTSDYFQWHFPLTSQEQRDLIVCAYDGTELVGTMPCFPVTYNVQGEAVPGTQSSWFSVAASHRRLGVGRQILKQVVQTHLGMEREACVGFKFIGSRISIGPRFWKAHENLQQVGFMARILDYDKARKWNPVRWEAAMLPFIRPFAGNVKPGRTNPKVREFREEDLPTCLELMKGVTQSVSWGLIWDEQSLRRQLEAGLDRGALVYCEGDRVVGLISYHILPFLGRTEERAAVLDLMAFGSMPVADQRAFIRDALAELASRGAIVALKMRFGDVSISPLMTTGFLWQLPNSITTQIITEGRLPRASRTHLLWR